MAKQERRGHNGSLQGRKDRTLGGQSTAILTGMASASRPRSAALRLSERRRHGSVNRFIQTSADLDMTFKSFVELYTADMKTRLKENTWATKEHIIRTKLLPYFGKLKMCNITAQQIITWQNEMLNHKDENGTALLAGVP